MPSDRARHLLLSTLIRAEATFFDRLAPQRLGGDPKLIRADRRSPEGPAYGERSASRSRVIQRGRKRAANGRERGREFRRGDGLR